MLLLASLSFLILPWGRWSRQRLLIIKVLMRVREELERSQVVWISLKNLALLVSLIDPFTDDICSCRTLSWHKDTQDNQICFYMWRTTVTLLTAIIEGITISFYWYVSFRTMRISDDYYGARRCIIGVITNFFLNVLQSKLFRIVIFLEIICKGMCLSPVALGYSIIKAALLDTTVPRSINKISHMRIATTINREANRSFFSFLL